MVEDCNMARDKIINMVFWEIKTNCNWQFRDYICAGVRSLRWYSYHGDNQVLSGVFMQNLC